MQIRFREFDYLYDDAFGIIFENWYERKIILIKIQGVSLIYYINGHYIIKKNVRIKILNHKDNISDIT